MLVALIGIVAITSFVGLTAHAQYAVSEERSGPISTWPVSWSNPCNIPGQSNGNDTTNVGNIHTFYTQGLGNLTLEQLYSRIMNSQSFQSDTSGKGWVTTYWGSQLISGPDYSNSYIVTTFVLLSHGRPDGYLTTYYKIATASVTTNYQSSQIANCPMIR